MHQAIKLYVYAGKGGDSFGVDGDQTVGSGSSTVGGVYSFVADAQEVWSEASYYDTLYSLPIDGIVASDDGSVMVLCVKNDSSAATGINGNYLDTSGGSFQGGVWVF